jgi:hypothetical protein
MIESEEGNQFDVMVRKFLEFVDRNELEIAGQQWVSLLDMVRYAGPDVISKDIIKNWSANYEEITDGSSMSLANME